MQISPVLSSRVPWKTIHRIALKGTRNSDGILAELYIKYPDEMSIVKDKENL